ncbi:Ecp16 [Fulvia fulva]|uniref:Ecp16 n=1 Tax=Passalora fulva TaxID=5499 RepID=A0A1P8YXL5_PASFU|nr:Ecp16 [Fulvia fulva]AQA29251.1 extracellular protein 16 [Fulvia fulva]KAK4618088.1 Ecp16 [Fulvia fulva]KAK4619058.1 Ecp16 [Fulvia fulva]UJO21194.1 Ecp16 [Fulvia fulva]WPV17802.1 Ecp16 [Fulvia fulva]
MHATLLIRSLALLSLHPLPHALASLPAHLYCEPTEYPALGCNGCCNRIHNADGTLHCCQSEPMGPFQNYKRAEVPVGSTFCYSNNDRKNGYLGLVACGVEE